MGSGTREEIAAHFGVGVASVNRWLTLRRGTGALKPRPAGGCRGRQQGLSTEGRKFAKETLEAVSDSTLVELVAGCQETFGEKISPQAMSIVVKKLGFTRKRRSSDQEQPTDVSLSRRGRTSSATRATWIQTSSSSLMKLE
jgi:transposase